MTDIRSDNISYWNRRAESYALINHAQFSNGRGAAWLAALQEPLHAAFPNAQPHELRILDVGCGPGLFSVLLALQGYRMTGVDYTPNMLEQARGNARRHDCDIEFVEADAEQLPFEEGMFHAVVSRNLTWNLPHPCRAYEEWRRVLAPDGVIVNFDANWYRHLFDEEARHAYEDDRARTREAGVSEECEVTGFEKMEDIAREVPLSRRDRPEWDLLKLREIGMSASVDERIWERVWNEEERINFASTPLFRIVATK